MNSRRFVTLLFSAVAFLSVTVREADAQAAPWVTVHYPFWEEGVMQPSDIDLTKATVLIYFAAVPTANGGLDTSNLDEASTVLAAAHAQNRPALLSVGGGGNGPAFVKNVQPAVVGKYVAAIMRWVKANNFDGVDVDFEPLPQSSSANFKTFVQMLRAQLTAYRKGTIITGDFQPDAATAKAAFPSRALFSQVNVMTYDMSGAYPGWVTWYDSAIYTTGSFASTENPFPSTDLALRQYLAAGFPSAQLGVGIDTFGYIWTNADEPEEAINIGTDPSDTQTSEMTYRDIMTDLYPGGSHNYDTAAEAPWIGLNSSNEFVSYTDPQLCMDKINYVKKLGLGGVMIWDITAQFQNSDNPFLDAIQTAISETGVKSTNWPAVDGAYAGIIETGENPGSNIMGKVSATVGGTGAVVISAAWGKTPTIFNGEFASDGTYTATVGRKALSALTITGTLSSSNGGLPLIMGGITDGTVSVPWYAQLATYSKTNRFPAPGSYACGLSASSVSSGPAGNSTAKLTIGATGSVVLAGKLPDGASFTTKSVIDSDGVIPISVPLYQSRGFLVNFLQWTNAPAVSGTLTWQKAPSNAKAFPGGFSESVIVTGM